MKGKLLISDFMVLFALMVGGLAACAERPPAVPRVPPSASEEAKRLQAPFGDTRLASPEIVAGGKRLYEGKGRCVVCHGTSGKGDGPAAHMHKPHPPRDFTDCAFHKQRTEGELFWVIKYGSPGTGMQALVPHVLTEDEAWQIVAYERAFCKGQG